MSESQFLALSSSLRDLLLYVDLVESGAPRVAGGANAKPLAGSSYLIPSGASAEFSFNGFCVRPSLKKASPGEVMQLLPDDQMWGDYLPQYRNLMAQKPDLPPVNVGRSASSPVWGTGMADYQVAVWALRGIGQNNIIPPQMASSLSPKHKQILLAAGRLPAPWRARKSLASFTVKRCHPLAISPAGRCQVL